MMYRELKYKSKFLLFYHSAEQHTSQTLRFGVNKLLHLLLCVGGGCMCSQRHGMFADMQRQCPRVSSLFPLCISWELNSGHQICGMCLYPLRHLIISKFKSAFCKWERNIVFVFLSWVHFALNLDLQFYVFSCNNVIIPLAYIPHFIYQFVC